MSKRQQQQQKNVLPDLQLANAIEHDKEANLIEQLTEDFKEMMSDKQVLESCVEGFVDSLVDEFTLGIIFDMHRKFKTNTHCLEIDSGDEEDLNEGDVLQQHQLKKNLNCVCPNCDQSVAASRFASHLESCMGIGRISRSSRNAARRINTNKDKGDPSSYGGVPSDDDDDDVAWSSTERKRNRDVDWSSAERKTNRKKDKNGGKKNRGTPKKKSAPPEPVEQLNVDIEGDDDELSSLRDMLHLQDRRSHSISPAEGSGNSTASPKKRDKSKKKNKTKDRNSPSTSMALD